MANLGISKGTDSLTTNFKELPLLSGPVRNPSSPESKSPPQLLKCSQQSHFYFLSLLLWQGVLLL